jgi:hypothetical protein
MYAVVLLKLLFCVFYTKMVQVIERRITGEVLEQLSEIAAAVTCLLYLISNVEIAV